jgi:hypothetical protein
MLHVISRFNTTLNDCNESGVTQLLGAVWNTDVESVSFLLLQDGILINKFSKVEYTVEGADNFIQYETPLCRAEELVREGAEDDTVSDDIQTTRMYIAGLLDDAGGVNQSFAEENE